MNYDRWIRTALIGMLALPLALISTGCGKTEKAPASETDLSQAGDLFKDPIKGAEADPNAVVITVNDTVITRGEIDTEMNRIMQMASRRLPPERLGQMRERFLFQAVESLVLKSLLVEAVGDEGVIITDEEVAEALQKFGESLPPDMTLDQILEMNQWTREEFDLNLRMDLSINKLLEEHVEMVTEPTDEEVVEFYEENKERFDAPEMVEARHILIAMEISDTPEQKETKKARAEELRKKLLAGADFAELAKESSDCPSKNRGGELGMFGRGQMVKPFEDAAFNQKADEIGEVIETQFGYHIIQVMKHEEAHSMGLDEVKERLVKGMHAQKRQLAAQEYVTSLKEKANIVYKDPSLTPPPAGMPPPGMF